MNPNDDEDLTSPQPAPSPGVEHRNVSSGEAVVEPAEGNEPTDPPAQNPGAGTVQGQTVEAQAVDAQTVEHAESPAGNIDFGSTPTEPIRNGNLPELDEDKSGEADAAVLAASRRHTRRSFLVAGAAAAAGAGFYAYLNLGPEDESQPDPLRHMFRFNAAASREVFHNRALSPTYPLSRSETLRINGVVGLNKTLAPDGWRLQMVGVRDAALNPHYVRDVTAWTYRYTAAADTESPGHDTKIDPSKQKKPDSSPDRGQQTAAASPGGEQNSDSEASDTAKKMTPEKMQAQAMAVESRGTSAPEDDLHLGRKPRGMGEAGESDSTLPAGTAGLLLQMPDVTKFPRHELVTQFKCIEGWSQIVHWAGVRMADFLDAYPPELVNGKEPRYVYMETPDGDYYVGYDLQVLRHPQTLLVTEMMGMPLTQFHGAPLRLHTPLKYGYKQIKRIGLIAYTNDKPDDYWTKLGYDWNAGL